MKKTIVFISHDATLTGAPIVLLHLVRWLKQYKKLNIVLLLRNGGVLQSEFEAVSNTFVWNKDGATSTWENRWERWSGTKRKHQRNILNQLKKLAPDLLYANTVVSAALGVELSQTLRCPVVCHVHELELVIRQCVGVQEFTELSTHIKAFFAASSAVAANLTKSYTIPTASITKVHEFVPVLDNIQFAEAGRLVRKELGIGQDKMLVIASGTLEWRKSPELFIQLAQQVQQAGGEMPYFIWVGGDLTSEFGIRSLYDLARTGLESHVKFLGARKNVHAYMSASDIFVLTSREDAYPLVCLEAASLGKPILCFADSGGMPEFVENDCGIIVPYLRIDLLAQAIIQLRDDRAKLQQFGANAAYKMRAKHTVDIAAQQIYSLLEEIV